MYEFLAWVMIVLIFAVLFGVLWSVISAPDTPASRRRNAAAGAKVLRGIINSVGSSGGGRGRRR